ncbi:MAG TPA: YoaK family protein [Stellaceae bacterium]|jgi:uncharacterized membrane protein YoaK (UPF0700 family)
MSDRGEGLVLAALLAGLAGMVDAIGYLHLKHLFVSYMSGNSTQLAVALGRGDFTEAAAILRLVVLFVAGAAAGQIIADSSGRWHLTAVLATVTVLLAIAAAAATRPEPMVLAMGALNASMHRAGNVGVSLTYVTGTLVKLGQGFGDFLARRAQGWDWLVQASPWAGLMVGATIGAVVHLRAGPAAAAWAPVVASGLFAAVSVAIPDPDRSSTPPARP